MKTNTLLGQLSELLKQKFILAGCFFIFWILSVYHDIFYFCVYIKYLDQKDSSESLQFIDREFLKYFNEIRAVFRHLKFSFKVKPFVVFFLGSPLKYVTIYVVFFFFF